MMREAREGGRQVRFFNPQKSKKPNRKDEPPAISQEPLPAEVYDHLRTHNTSIEEQRGIAESCRSAAAQRQAAAETAKAIVGVFVPAHWNSDKTSSPRRDEKGEESTDDTAASTPEDPQSLHGVFGRPPGFDEEKPQRDEATSHDENAWKAGEDPVAEITEDPFLFVKKPVSPLERPLDPEESTVSTVIEVHDSSPGRGEQEESTGDITAFSTQEFALLLDVYGRPPGFDEEEPQRDEATLSDENAWKAEDPAAEITEEPLLPRMKPVTQLERPQEPEEMTVSMVMEVHDSEHSPPMVPCFFKRLSLQPVPEEEPEDVEIPSFPKEPRDMEISPSRIPCVFESDPFPYSGDIHSAVDRLLAESEATNKMQDEPTTSVAFLKYLEIMRGRGDSRDLQKLLFVIGTL